MSRRLLVATAAALSLLLASPASATSLRKPTDHAARAAHTGTRATHSGKSRQNPALRAAAHLLHQANVTESLRRAATKAIESGTKMLHEPAANTSMAVPKAAEKASGKPAAHAAKFTSKPAPNAAKLSVKALPNATRLVHKPVAKVVERAASHAKPVANATEFSVKVKAATNTTIASHQRVANATKSLSKPAANATKFVLKAAANTTKSLPRAAAVTKVKAAANTTKSLRKPSANATKFVLKATANTTSAAKSLHKAAANATQFVLKASVNASQWQELENVSVATHFKELSLGPFPSSAAACNFCLASFTKHGEPLAGPMSEACACMAIPDGAQHKMYCATRPSAASFVASKGGCRCKAQELEHVGGTTCEKLA